MGGSWIPFIFYFVVRMRMRIKMKISIRLRTRISIRTRMRMRMRTRISIKTRMRIKVITYLIFFSRLFILEPFPQQILSEAKSFSLKRLRFKMCFVLLEASLSISSSDVSLNIVKETFSASLISLVISCRKSVSWKIMFIR